MSNLPEHVEHCNRARRLFRRGERILVAVSGGVDSMVLLHLLHALAPRLGWKLTVAHFNHQLRGRASDGDEQFVKKAAKSLGLTAIVERGNVRAMAKQHGISIEMAARDLRHEFLARTARRLRIRSIALAHHADDQVELFFLRLLRGAGGEGLAGMKWRSPSPADVRSPAFTRSGSRLASSGTEFQTRLARPLLDLSKAEFEIFARENKIGFRNDATNASLDFQRNRIRHELLPLLKSRYQPALARTVLRAMNIVADEAEFVSRAAEKWLTQRRRPPFAVMAIAIQRRCLQIQLVRLGRQVDFDLIEQLREAANQPVSVAPGISVLRDSSGIVRIRTHSAKTFNANHLEVHLESRAGEALFDGVCCRWRVESVGNRKLPKPAPRAGRECFDAGRIGPRVILRHWRAGDRFQPIGIGTPVKLQDWFTNRKIPRERRHELLVAESAGGEIFWVEGERISGNFKLTPRTSRLLIWRWRRA